MFDMVVDCVEFIPVLINFISALIFLLCVAFMEVHVIFLIENVFSIFYTKDLEWRVLGY